MPIEEDRARKSASPAGQSLASYSPEAWRSGTLPQLQERAVPIAALIASRGADFAAFAEAHGNQTGEGAPWTFVVEGAGRVVETNRQSRRGTLALRLNGAGEGPVALMQVGPFVSGTAIRDSLDNIAFDQFADQLQYAAAGNALTQNAMEASTPALDSALVGSTVRFLAAVPVRDEDSPLVLTPIQVEVAP